MMKCSLVLFAILAGLVPAQAVAQTAYDGPSGSVSAMPTIAEHRALSYPAPGAKHQSEEVPGQAPFNNQLRKFSDPLNANGAK